MNVQYVNLNNLLNLIIFITNQGCVLCLTNPSNFIFNDCGHMTAHIESNNKAEISDKCMVCKIRELKLKQSSEI